MVRFLINPGMPDRLSSTTANLHCSDPDYGESHYIGPIKGAQPNSHAWVDGYPHTPWLELSGYFARVFKEGVYPFIERDLIFMWSRPHLKDAVATKDEVPRPDRWQLVSVQWQSLAILGARWAELHLV